MRLTNLIRGAVLSVLLCSVAGAQTPSALYFWNPQGDNNTPVDNDGALTVLGVVYVDGGAPWTLTDLGVPGTPASTVVTSNNIKQYTSTTIATGTGGLTLNHVYKLSSPDRINAFFGGDCCSNYGSFQIPSDEDASRRVGQSFTFWAPVLNGNTQTWIFSRSAGTVTVTDTATNLVVATTTFTGPRQQFQVPNADLSAQHFYTFTSSNCTYSVEQSVINGVATIPAASGWDVGTYGMFAIEANFDGAYALYGYADGGTTFLVHDVTTAGAFPDVTGTVAENQVFYVEGHNGQPYPDGGVTAAENLNGHQFVVTTTSGELAIWAGDDQDSQDGSAAHPEICGVSGNGVYHSIACMGDDITFDSGNLSSTGTTIIVNPRTLGGQIFAPISGTTLSVVNVNGTVIIASTTTTAADQVFSIPEVTSLANNVDVIITANQPVIVQTTGGNQMDDWGKYLIEVPGSAGTPAAPTITGPASPAAATFTLIGSAPSGSTVTIFDSAGNIIGTATASATGAWSLPITESGDGSYTFFANDSDNGIGSGPSANFTVTVVTAPTMSAPTSGQLICTAGFTVTGAAPVADKGDTVTVTITPSSGTATTATGTVSATGTYSIPITFSADGSYTVGVTQTAPDGVVSAATQVSVTVDFAIVSLVLTEPAAAGQIYVTDTPLISGTGGAGDPITVTIKQGTTIITAPTTTVAANGTWSVQPTLPPGAYTVSAEATSGNACNLSSSASGTLVINTTAATITSPLSGSTLNTTTQTITGTGVPGTQVSVIVNGGTPVLVTVGSSGDWSTPVTLTAGSNTVTAAEQDASGGEQSPPASATYTVETTATVITNPTSGETLGQSPVTLAGTAAANTTIDLVIDGADGGVVTTLTTSVNGSGAWSTTTPLANGTYTLTATDVDGVGDLGSPASTSFTVDTTAPALTITAPVNGSVTTNNDTGSPPPDGGSADILVAGTGDNGSGITVVLTNSAGTVVFTGTGVVAGGTWSVPISASLADDTYTATVTETNTLGNSSTAATTFTVAAPGPQTPTITAPAGSTNNPTPTITGTAAPNSTISVTLTGPGGTQTFDNVVVDGTGNWSQPITTALAAGSYTITATATNAAGDTSTATATFTEVTTAPAAPVILDPTDGGTTTSTPEFSGTAAPDTTITLTVTGSSGAPITFTTTTNGTGQWSTSLPTGDSLPTGITTVSATATDLAGNVSPVSGTITFTVATGAVAPPVLTGPPNGSVTNNTTPTITGTAVPNSTVTLTVTGPGGFTETLTGTASATGSFSIPTTTPLGGDGTYTVTGTASIGGQTSQASAPLVFTLDTTAPAAPTIINPPSGSTQASTTPTISGTAEAGSTVTVTINGVAVGTTTADNNGNWTFTPSSPLPTGTTTVTATATDVAGNVSGPSATDTFTIDPTATQPTVTLPSNGQVLGTTLPTLTGTATPGATVTVSIDGTVVGTTVASTTGTWTFIPLTPLGAGQHTVQVTEAVTGAVPSNVVAFVVDTTAPASPVILSPSAGQTEGQTFTVSGTGVPGTTINIEAGGVVVGTTTVAANGTWSTSVTVSGTGTTVLTATSTDGLNQTSLPSAPVTVNVVVNASSSSSSSASSASSSSGSGSAVSLNSSSSSGASTSSLTSSSSSGSLSTTTSTSGSGSSGSTGTTVTLSSSNSSSSSGSFGSTSGSGSSGSTSSGSGSSSHSSGSSGGTGAHGTSSGAAGTSGSASSATSTSGSSSSHSSSGSSGSTSPTSASTSTNAAASTTGSASSNPGSVGGAGCNCGNGGDFAALWLIGPMLGVARRRRFTAGR